METKIYLPFAATAALGTVWFLELRSETRWLIPSEMLLAALSKLRLYCDTIVFFFVCLGFVLLVSEDAFCWSMSSFLAPLLRLL